MGNGWKHPAHLVGELTGGTDATAASGFGRGCSGLGQRDDLALRGRGLGRPQVCLGTGRIAARPTRGFPLDQSPSLG